MDPRIPDIERQALPLELPGIALTGILAGAFVGASTNAVNGLISPIYFTTILRWNNSENVWRVAVAQGIFEGLLCGFFFALIFTIATAIITSNSCTFRFAFKHLAGIIAGAYGLWILSGLSAMGLAALSPESYRGACRAAPDDFGELLAYAWVGGSIWGVQFGGFLSLVLGLFFLRANWRRQLKEMRQW